MLRQSRPLISFPPARLPLFGITPREGTGVTRIQKARHDYAGDTSGKAVTKFDQRHLEPRQGLGRAAGQIRNESRETSQPFLVGR
jgi:hypothetical protein